jgi:hypothetical protein
MKQLNYEHITETVQITVRSEVLTAVTMKSTIFWDVLAHTRLYSLTSQKTVLLKLLSTGCSEWGLQFSFLRQAIVNVDFHVTLKTVLPGCLVMEEQILLGMTNIDWLIAGLLNNAFSTGSVIEVQRYNDCKWLIWNDMEVNGRGLFYDAIPKFI